ncbi:MAG: hypothetical protein ACLFPR_11910 [Desulfococcaceae bacterium]
MSPAALTEDALVQRTIAGDSQIPHYQEAVFIRNRKIIRVRPGTVR